MLPKIVLPVSLLAGNQPLVNTHALWHMRSGYWHCRKLLFHFKLFAIDS